MNNSKTVTANGSALNHTINGPRFISSGNRIAGPIRPQVRDDYSTNARHSGGRSPSAFRLKTVLCNPKKYG